MKNGIFVLTFIATFFYLPNCLAQCHNIDLKWEKNTGTRIEDCGESYRNSFKYGRGDRDFLIEHDGLERTYSVHAPLSYNRKTPLPVVLVLHGGYGNAKYAEKQTWMSKAADKHAFIAVYPEALIGPENPDSNLKYQHWNGGPRVDPNKSPE
jgi:poly(3-hydroxybutyrate) depolymerase